VNKVYFFYPRKGHRDFTASFRWKEWRWRYWPRSVELLSTANRVNGAVYMTNLQHAVAEGLRMAERVKLGEKGLPQLEPLANGGQWAALYPKLLSYLIDANYTDGSVRQQSRMFCEVKHGQWIAILKDPDQAIQLEVAVDYPEEMMAALEAALSSAKPPWRHDPYARRIAPAKKK